FTSAIADLTATPTADLSRWTHRVGVMGSGCDRHPHLGTPSDLARRSATALDVAIGELSPWRSVLPPRTCRRRAFGTGGGTKMACAKFPRTPPPARVGTCARRYQR